MFFDDLSMTTVGEDGVVVSIPIESRKITKKKIIKKIKKFELRSETNNFNKLIQKLFSQGPTLYTSLNNKNLNLKKLGYRTYKEYEKSSHWENVCLEYDKSCLLKKCIVCGSKDFKLRHTSNKYFGKEDISSLLPICNKHSSKLDMSLTEHAVAIEHTLKLLPMIFWPQRVFQPGLYGTVEEKMFLYKKRILFYKANQINEYCVVRDFRVGNKRSNENVIKEILINEKNFMFSFKNGKIRLGYNGEEIGFGQFCENLEMYVGEK